MSEWARERLVEVLPEEVELPRRLRQYINLRWLAIVAIAAIIVITQGVLGIGYPLGPVLGTVGILLVYNLIFPVVGWAGATGLTYRPMRGYAIGEPLPMCRLWLTC